MCFDSFTVKFPISTDLLGDRLSLRDIEADIVVAVRFSLKVSCSKSVF